MRIIPIALAASLLALPLQFEVVAKQTQAFAKAAANATGFGEHPRPWAKDLLDGKETMAAAAATPPASPAVEEPAADLSPPPPDPAAEAARALCARGEESWSDRLAQLKAAELRVGAQVEKLTRLKGALETLLEKRRHEETGDIQRLVNLYRNMKPVEAAAILADLDMPIVVSIVMAMSEREAAPILAQMPKNAAQRVTREIARQRSLSRVQKDIS
jgi:flagellar motility protein MotE (MotC chaperone)